MHTSVVLSAILTIAIGVLLVEYMTDGTIYNKAFNVLCIVTIVLILLNMALTVYDVIATANAEFLLATFHFLIQLLYEAPANGVCLLFGTVFRQ